MKSFHLSNQQIIYTTLFLAVLFLTLDNFWGFGLVSGVRDPEALNPASQTTMISYGQVLASKAELAIADADAAIASQAALPKGQIAAYSRSSLPEPWQKADNSSATPSIPLSQKIANYEIVQLDAHPANLPVVGEQITLSMLNDQKISVSVESAVTSENGDYTWRGHLANHGDDYPVIMTYGEHSTFATITTPEGAYTLESVDGLGWLYKNPSVIELSAPGVNDFLEVDSTR